MAGKKMMQLAATRMGAAGGRCAMVDAVRSLRSLHRAAGPCVLANARRSCLGHPLSRLQQPAAGTRMFVSASAGSEGKCMRVAVVGCGPAGFYTARDIMKGLENVEVDFLEMLPTPYGW
eukprot:767230-Hanusia_phi.AAC.14